MTVLRETPAERAADVTGTDQRDRLGGCGAGPGEKRRAYKRYEGTPTKRTD
jgi:hypothetical protein